MENNIKVSSMSYVDNKQKQTLVRIENKKPSKGKPEELHLSVEETKQLIQDLQIILLTH
jgi:hypothetical protein